MAIDFKDLKNLDLKSLDFKNIYEWPFYGRGIVFLVVCLGVFYLGYLIDFSSFSGQIYSRVQQERDLKSQVKAILDTEEDMKELVSQYPEVVKLLNAWQGQLIDGDNLPDLLNKILKIGASNQLQFSQFAPGVKKQRNDYLMVPIKVVARGNYNQIANFISQVANMPQLIAIGDFVIQKQVVTDSEKTASEQAQSSATASTTAGITLEVYYLANKK